MNEEKKPSAFWSVVGIALPVLTLIFAIIGGATGVRAGIWIPLAVFSGGNTLLAIQRVYAVFGKKSE